MTIKRNVNGIDMEFELTRSELIKASMEEEKSQIISNMDVICDFFGEYTKEEQEKILSEYMEETYESDEEWNVFVERAWTIIHELEDAGKIRKLEEEEA